MSKTKEFLNLTNKEYLMLLDALCHMRDFSHDDNQEFEVVQSWNALIEKVHGHRLPLYWEPTD